MLTEDLREDRGGQVLPGCISVPHAGGEEEEEGVFLSSFTPTPSPEGVYGFLFFISLNSSVQ